MFWYDRYWGCMPMDLSGIKKSKAAKLQNNMAFTNLFENYFTMAQNLFEWSGLPPTCDERFLERCLLLYGKAMIAKVDGSYVTLGAAPGAGLNLYGYPLKAFGWGINGFNREFSTYVPGADEGMALRQASDGRDKYPAPEAVICYDNIDAFPYVSYVFDSAQRLGDLLRSCDVAVNNLKCPFIVTCEESQLSSVKAAFDKRDQNSAVIITSGSINLDSFKVWQTGVEPEVLKTFWEQYRNIEAQLLEILGIDSNSNTDKKERLLVDEINANNEEASINLMKRLRQREIFCERVHDCFPELNISVRLRKEVSDNGQTDDVDGDDRNPSDGGPVQRDED